MFYHLNELYGMSKWFDKFKIFSITEQQINGIFTASKRKRFFFFKSIF